MRATAITSAIKDFILSDLRPINIIEGSGFKKLIKLLEPSYHLPSRKYFTTLIEERYVEAKVEISKIISQSKSKGIALTCDIWTSIATEAYFSLTAHLISNDWEMKTFVLATMPLEERHTGENIESWIIQILNDFNIKTSDVCGIVTDNATNMVSASKALVEKYNWLTTTCSGHSLQLVVGAALKITSVERAVKAARSLVEHFKKSEVATTAFKKKQKEMGCADHALIQDVITRWNSTLYMIDRILEQRWPITAVLTDPEVTRGVRLNSDLKPEQWNLLAELKEILQPFEVATTFLSGESYVSFSSIPIIISGLLRAMSIDDDDTTILINIKNILKTQLENRWHLNDNYTSNPTVLAAALDPRFKNLKFMNAEQVAAVRTIIRLKAAELQGSLDLPTLESAKLAKAKTPLDKLFDGMNSGSEDENEEFNTESEHGKELTKFYQERVINRNEDPLLWWKANEKDYPTVAKLAGKYLCIPATSTPSERVFSVAGLTVSKLRASLSKDHVNMLVFLNKNIF